MEELVFHGLSVLTQTVIRVRLIRFQVFKHVTLAKWDIVLGQESFLQFVLRHQFSITVLNF